MHFDVRSRQVRWNAPIGSCCILNDEIGICALNYVRPGVFAAVLRASALEVSSAERREAIAMTAEMIAAWAEAERNGVVA